MPNLKIRVEGKETLRQIEGDFATIGRASTNTIELPEAAASKEHCRIERQGDRWKFIDLESKNGTLINGAFRNKAWLSHGDAIRIGKHEIRFGLEGGARKAAAATAAPAAGRTSARRPAVAARGRGAARGEPVEGEEEQLAVPDKAEARARMVKIGLSLLGVGLVLVFLLSRVLRDHGDAYNFRVMAVAEKLVMEGRYDEGIAYLQQNADPKGRAYFRVQEKLAQYLTLKPSQQKVNAEFEAREIVRQLSRLIPLYDDGRESGDPQRILKYVEELKTTYGETDYCAQARRSWPGWFEGKVPPRGADQGQSGGYIRRDFDAAVARAREYEKEWRFSEARETIETFLSTREATMNADDLALYRQEVKDQLTRIEGLADSVYRGQVQEAEKLVKNKRYDQAIELYRKVIERFGIDAYRRKAQAAIDAVAAAKAKGG